MVQRLAPVLASTFFVVLAAACSSTADGTAPPTQSSDAGVGTDAAAVPPRELVDAFCDHTTAGFASYLDACCNAKDRTTQVYGLFATVVHQAIDSCKSVVGRSLERGRVAYSEEGAAACRTAFAPYFASDACTNGGASGSLSAACKGAFAGQQADGDACVADFECQDGLFCQGAKVDAEGHCGAPVANGAACASSGTAQSLAGIVYGDHPHCQDGAYCATDSKRCAALLANGASCTEDAACKTGNCLRGKCSATSTAALDEPCLAKADCAAPNTCLPSGSGSARTCQPRLEPGSTCQADDDCHGLCDRPDGGATGKCVAYCTGATR